MKFNYLIIDLIIVLPNTDDGYFITFMHRLFPVQRKNSRINTFIVVTLICTNAD